MADHTTLEPHGNCTRPLSPSGPRPVRQLHCCHVLSHHPGTPLGPHAPALSKQITSLSALVRNGSGDGSEAVGGMANCRGAHASTPANNTARRSALGQSMGLARFTCWSSWDVWAVHVGHTSGARGPFFKVGGMPRMATGSNIAHHTLTQVQLHHAQWALRPMVAGQRLQVACRQVKCGDRRPPCQRVLVRVHHRGRLRALGLLRPPHGAPRGSSSG